MKTEVHTQLKIKSKSLKELAPYFKQTGDTCIMMNSFFRVAKIFKDEGYLSSEIEPDIADFMEDNTQEVESRILRACGGVPTSADVLAYFVPKGYNVDIISYEDWIKDLEGKTGPHLISAIDKANIINNEYFRSAETRFKKNLKKAISSADESAVIVRFHHTEKPLQYVSDEIKENPIICLFFDLFSSMKYFNTGLGSYIAKHTVCLLDVDKSFEVFDPYYGEIRELDIPFVKNRLNKESVILRPRFSRSCSCSGSCSCSCSPPWQDLT